VHLKADCGPDKGGGIMAKAKCFVIQPFGKKQTENGALVDNDEIYNELQKLEFIDPTFPVEIYRSDMRKVSTNDHVITHVFKCIDQADFCIADISGNNPNVLFEVGYARGKGLKVILVCQDHREIPSDLAGIMYVEYKYDSDLSSLVCSIRKHLLHIKDEVADRIEQNNVKSEMPPGGEVRYLPKRNDALIRKMISSSKNRIDILQTNLSILQNEFTDDITKALDNDQLLELRILTLDPQSVFVNYRANQLESTETRIFRDELQNALAAIYYRFRKYGARVQIKIYDDFPSQIAFFFDHHILSCVVSAMGRSRDNCAFLMTPNLPGTQRSFTDHFSQLWNHKSYTYSDLGKNNGEDNIS
jgi:hypothetical protein